LLDKIKKAKQVLRRDGVAALLKTTAIYLLTHTRRNSCIKLVHGELFHQKLYTYLRLGYWPHIQNPRTFNEKLLHRKLYTNNPQFTVVEDKWAVREYVRNAVGEDILPTVYHVTDDPDDIPFDNLPDAYVLKPTHMSGNVVIIDQDENPDITALREQCRCWLSTTYGTKQGEYWYRDIKPRIIVEERLTDDRLHVPADFKFYVFHGRVEMLYVLQHANDGADKQYNYYTRQWEPLDIQFHHWEVGPGYDRPDKLERMIEIAELLGDGFDHIRVDLYAPDDDRIIFGELTVAEGSGWNQFSAWEDDLAIGSYWTVDCK